MLPTWIFGSFSLSYNHWNRADSGSSATSSHFVQNRVILLQIILVNFFFHIGYPAIIRVESKEGLIHVSAIHTAGLQKHTKLRLPQSNQPASVEVVTTNIWSWFWLALGVAFSEDFFLVSVQLWVLLRLYDISVYRCCHISFSSKVKINSAILCYGTLWMISQDLIF
jgi:hypothetical protein